MTTVELPVLMRTTGLTKLYHRGTETVHAIEDVNLALHGGEVTAVVGPSGSGKTTLLYLLAGWETADSGTVRWNETDSVPSDVPWSGLALVPQSLGLIEELTVRENVTLPLRLQKRADENRVDALLDGLGLSQLADRYPLETSLGEQQRAAVARALVIDPQVILADEPTGHQDEAWAEAVFFLLGEAAARGSCCIVATHDPAIARFADRVVGMRDGRVLNEAPAGAPARREGSMWAPTRSDRD